ncbi:hypothetical protein niasHS_012294 [Heterodera schachtii]|uniref:C-type lectin domain-containing protein n=1 Tax=Heterodera schachtii TaxID=97005 RepID=A0ABD2IRB3_HETSC
MAVGTGRKWRWGRGGNGGGNDGIDEEEGATFWAFSGLECARSPARTGWKRSCTLTPATTGIIGACGEQWTSTAWTCCKRRGVREARVRGQSAVQAEADVRGCQQPHVEQHSFFHIFSSFSNCTFVKTRKCLIVGACGESCYKVPICAEGYAYFNGYCYKAFTKADKEVKYSEAQKLCKSDGAELVSMHSELEREFVNVVAKLDTAVDKYGLDVLWRDEVCEKPEDVDKVMSKQKQMYGDGSNHTLSKFSGTLGGCGDYCKTGY